MEEENKTAIYLNDEDAKLFLKFMEYKDIWRKVFDLRNGSIELHFDGQKKLRKVNYNFFENLSTHLLDKP